MEVVAVGARGKIEALIPQDVVRIGRRGEHSIGHVDEVLVRDDSLPHLGLHHGASWLEHRAFAERIRSGGEADVTVADGLVSVAMGVAAHRSIAEGRAVAMVEVL